MRNILRFALTGVTLVTSLIVVTVVRAESPSNNQPATAAYISAPAQRIAANATQWYKFDYSGDRSEITLIMPNGANSLVAFNVFTPDEVKSWWDTKPIGRGTAYQIDCDTGDEDPMGACQSDDFKWVGKFNAAGTYYVQVVNYNTGTANFTLTLSGTGISVGSAAQTIIAPATPQQTHPVLPVTGGIWPNAPTPTPVPDLFRFWHN